MSDCYQDQLEIDVDLHQLLSISPDIAWYLPSDPGQLSRSISLTISPDDEGELSSVELYFAQSQLYIENIRDPGVLQDLIQHFA
ncbi:hypothetical protein [Streptomyces sp. NPDC047972]|uniref:hypothetical protein n=1 Tax=Streptomyces sp. NPDC047972 TaxID=3365493 RepID=UPI00371FA3EE